MNVKNFIAALTIFCCLIAIIVYTGMRSDNIRSEANLVKVIETIEDDKNVFSSFFYDEVGADKYSSSVSNLEESYSIEVLTVKSRAEAEKVIEDLNSHRSDCYFVEDESALNSFRVRCGIFSNEQIAKDELLNLTTVKNIDAIIIKL